MVNPCETLYELNDLRKIKKYCDVALIVEGEQFHCHRAILAAAVDYFDKMFGSSFSESKSTVVELKNISKTYFDVFLEYVYTGKIQFNRLSVEHLLTFSSYFSIDCLTEKCVDYIKSVMNIDMGLNFYFLAQHISCAFLKQFATEFIESNFSAVAATEAFLEIPFSILNEFISSDSTIVESEEFIFETINEWINHDPANRKAHFPELFEKIRFKFVKSDYIANDVLCNDLFIKYGSRCAPLISEKDGCRPRIRGSPQLIYLFGRKKVTEPNTNIGVVCWNGSGFNDISLMNWSGFYVTTLKVVHHNNLLHMLAYGREPHLNYFGYFGNDKWIPLRAPSSKSYYPNNLVSSDASNCIYMSNDEDAYCYNPHHDTWDLFVAEGYTNNAGVKILDAALLSWKNNLFSVGGCSRSRCPLKVYDPRVGMWESRTDVPDVVDFESGVAVFKDDIYVSNRERNTLIYDIRKDNWRSGSQMTQERWGHCLVERDKKLCAIGGYAVRGYAIGGCVYGGSYAGIDIFDSELDQWSSGPLITGFKNAPNMVGVSCNKFY